MEDLQQKIIELMDLFDEGEVTTADKIDRPQRALDRDAFDDFNKRNPMAGGGMLVQPSADGSRPGYSKSKMGESKLGEGMENIFKEKIGPGKFRYFIKVRGKKYGQAIGEENLPTLKKKRDQVIKKLYPNRITNEDFSKLKNLKKYENMSSVEFSKVLNDKGFTTISGKEWNPKSTLRKIDELDLELVGRARSEDEIFKILKNIEGGPSKIKLYKEGIIPLETLRDIATDYEKRQSPEYKETKKKIDTKANLKRAQELGNFPPGANPNDNLWAQVYRSAKDGDGRWRIVSKLPPLKDGKRDWIKNGDWKKMKVVDTQTGTEFGYKDLKSYLDNLEGPGTYDNALKPWQNKKDLNAIKIKYRGNTISLGKVLSNKKIEKEFFEKTGKFPKGVEVEEINKFYKKKYPYGKSNFAVNHPEGVKNNWWNAEVVHKDANDRLERLDKSFRASLNSAQNKTQRNRIIELYKKDVKNIGNVTSVFEGQTIGKSNIFSAARDAFKTEGLTKTFAANVDTIKKQVALLGGGKCKTRGLLNQGGRVGLQDGTPNVDVCFRNALERIRKGGVDFTRAEAMNFNKLTKGLRAIGASNIMKFGILPEVLFEGALIADKMASEGDSFMQGLRNSYVAIPFQAMGMMKTYDEGRKDEILAATPESQRGKVLDVMNLQDTIKKRNELAAQSQNLKNQIEDTDRISDGAFGYVGDSQDLQKRLSETRADLQDLYRGDAGRAERMLTSSPLDLNIKDQLTMDAYKSAVEKADADRASNILFAPGAGLGIDTQIKKRMKDLPITPEIAKEQLQATGDFFGTGYTPLSMNRLFTLMGREDPRFGFDETGKYSEEKGLNDYMNYLRTLNFAENFRDEKSGGGRAGFKVGSVRKGVLSLIDEGIKKTPKDTTTRLDKLIKETLDEDFFDKKDRIVDTLNAKIARERKNFPYNQQVFEEPSQLDFYDAITKSNFRTKTGPFFDYQKRKNKAGGGLLKQAGDRSGPPPESGPNSQGLQGLLNRVKKV